MARHLAWPGTHRRATEVSYESHIRLYLKPKIGHIRRDRLTVAHVVEMFNRIEDDNDAIEANNSDRRALESRIRNTPKRALREQLAELPPYRRPVRGSSQQRILATLRAALNDAIRQQLATFNPAAHVTVEATKVRPLIWTSERVEQWRRTGLRPGPVMVWTPEQAGGFLDHVAEHDPDYEALWHVATFRGTRRGELAGLGWTDTNLDGATLQILTQLTEVDYQVTEGAPKSAAGERTVSLDREGVRLLRQHRRHQWAERQRLGSLWVESGRVFTKPDGSELRPSWISDRFARLSAAAGVPPIRLHDLRHVAATLMLAASVDLKVIQETLGHSTLATTSDLYTSVLPEVANAAAEATRSIVPRRKTLGHPSGTHGPPTTIAEQRGDALR
ncbi:site-specific integrase [Actinosynnema sp. NPDC023587]|uniref:site-specific integrase n=1 Tax=Actinosynnema sp. NPDC023587 TaxID=3154695 RepID=UPI0033D0E058